MEIMKQLKTWIVYSVAVLTFCTGLSLSSCGGNSDTYDTQSNQNFDDEENLPTSTTGDTTNPAGIRDDSTPAAHPDLDDNPIIDKGMSADSAMRQQESKPKK